MAFYRIMVRRIKPLNMKASTSLRLTRYLIISSIIGSLVSIYTLHMGAGELYPFFTWKLYSQPLGSARTFTEYRIYCKKNGENHFRRIAIKPTSTFTAEEYVYTFNSLIAKTLKDTTIALGHKNKLLSFIKHVQPGADQYKVVAETYHPKDLANGISQYDTITVISF